MKTNNLKLVLAIIAMMYGSNIINGQNIIIQQNNSNNQQQKSTTKVIPSKPKSSLGVGFLELQNEGYGYWACCEYNLIKGVYIKKRGKPDYDKTNYCEKLQKGSTKILLESEGIYDVKVVYYSEGGDCHNKTNRTSSVEIKSVLIKFDYITRLVFGNETLKAEIPQPM